MLTSKNLDVIADQYQLTYQQKEVFLAKILDKKSYSQIAEELNTSENACQKCMGEVYKKFNIEGERRGKERRLVKCLNILVEVSDLPTASTIIPQNIKFILEGVDHHQYEEQQKIELREFFSISDISHEAETEKILKLSNWIVKDFKLISSYHRISQAKVKLWNPTSEREYTTSLSGEGSINTLCQTLIHSFKNLLGKTNNINDCCFHRIDFKNESSGGDNNIQATIILLNNHKFYVGKATQIDIINASFKACVNALNQILSQQPTSIDELSQDMIGDLTIQLSGDLRFEQTMELLKKRNNTEILAVSNGSLIKWWESQMGHRFLEFHKTLVKRNIKIKRVFVIENMSQDIEDIMNNQRKNKIEVRYIFKKDFKNIDISEVSKLSNFLVSPSVFRTEMQLNNDTGKEQGSISFDKFEIKKAEVQFNKIWEKATEWNGIYSNH